MSFFFSSRRRHTRSLCDWSSDVCSSDLAGLNVGAYLSPHVRAWSERIRIGGGEADFEAAVARVRRSEERRVGKECRSLGMSEPYRKGHRHEEHPDDRPEAEDEHERTAHW